MLKINLSMIITLTKLVIETIVKGVEDVVKSEKH